MTRRVRRPDLVRHKVAEYDGGTRVTFECAAGHRYTTDFSKGPIPKRIGPAGVALFVRQWQHNGVTSTCPKCRK